MLLAGVRRTVRFADAGGTIAQIWSEFAQLQLTFIEQRVAYGVICSSNPQDSAMEYMAAGEVAAFDALAPTVGRIRTPAARYAVFAHDDHVTTIAATWALIWREWAPHANLASSPEFERYGESFDPAKAGGVEIWIPVAY
jgi:AraC family transcriptional regulator